MTPLINIFYNKHFLQMVYPDKVDSYLQSLWGDNIPWENIEVVEYSAELKAPFNFNDALEIFLLTQQTLPVEDVPNPNLKSVLEEVKKTSLGKKFIKIIMENNKALNENGLPLIPMEFDETEVVEPAYYTLDQKITPVVMRKGKI